MKYPVPVALIAAMLAAPAFAQDAAEPPVDPQALEGDMLTVGLGIGAVPSYEGSDDTVIALVPGVRGRVSGINFTLRGNRFSADLVPTGGGPGWDLQLGPVVQANFNRSAAIVDAQVRLLPKRKTAIEVGGFVGLARQGVITSDYDKLGASVAIVRDVAGSHGSYTIVPAIDYGTPLSTTTYVGISASGTYMGAGYGDAYFSIDAAGSAASGLPAYAAGKGWKDWTVGVLAAVSITGDLTKGLSLIGGGSYRRLLGDAAASPVTSVAGSRHQWVGMAGLAYTF